MSTVLFTDKYLYRQKKFYDASPMPLRIKDPATEKSAEERLQRVRRSHGGHSLAAEMLEIGKHCASLRDLDPRTADEILGYDEHGLPG